MTMRTQSSRAQQLTRLAATIVGMTLSVAAVVAPAQTPRAAAGPFVFSYFQGEGEDGLHLAWSADGLVWEALNRDQPLVAPTVGRKLMRDPSIVQGPDGMFHLVWSSGWWELGFGYARSKDLVHWSDQRYIAVNRQVPQARNTSAPDLYYDPTTRQFVITFATTVPGRFPDTDAGPDHNHRLYWVTTKDFDSFSEPALAFNPGYNCIDGTIFATDGRITMIYKDERLGHKQLHVTTADALGRPWSPPTAPILTRDLVEGPTVLRVGSAWRLYFDCYTKGHFGAAESADGVTWRDITDKVRFPEGARHGTAFPVSAAILDSLRQLDGQPYPAARKSEDELRRVRIGTPVDGHIHPAACVTPRGTIVVTYGQVNHRDLRITRSTDGGRTFSEPVAFPHTVGKTFYPGSLTTLRDGRVLHAWNRWSGDTNESEPRSVLYSLSTDDGRTWSEPRAFPRDEKMLSVIRHPIVELADGRWLASLSDRTLVFDSASGQGSPWGDGRSHGLVPIVRTARGSFVSGAGWRSTDEGQTWREIPGFPNLKEQGWRHEMVGLSNGLLLASEILGPGVGGERIRYVVSRDDGQTWAPGLEYYNPGRPIGGRACPRTVQLDDKTIGVVFYDVDARQPGGPALYFLRIPLAKLESSPSKF